MTFATNFVEQEESTYLFVKKSLNSPFHGVYCEAIYLHSKHSFLSYVKSVDIDMTSTYILEGDNASFPWVNLVCSWNTDPPLEAMS